jgi:hypothetical protein
MNSKLTREMDVDVAFAADGSAGALTTQSLAICSVQRCVVMNWHDAALGMAGVIGSSVAVVHGVLTQRLMVGPFEQLADGRITAPIRRLVPLLLQFSTFNWFVGGIALIVAANAFEYEARLATGLLVGSSYLFGCLGNLWATRGRHPGWMFYVLIAYGVG